MRLIDADKLKKEVLMWMPSDPCGIAEKERPIETDIVVSLMMEIEDAPTIDAVEVVRCKDCKHAHMTYGGECKYCDKWEEDGEALYLDGDFFCAYGERREP